MSLKILSAAEENEGAGIGMIKNVIFDIGGVIARLRTDDFLADKGYDPETAGRIEAAGLGSQHWKELDRGVMPFEQVIELFVSEDRDIADEIRAAYSDMKGLVRICPYAIDWIDSLKRRGYKVYYLSNWPYKLRCDEPDAIAFIPHMDGGVFSYEEKLIKPDPAIYQRLMSRYGLNAEESVFIDDLAENVAAARELGMKGIIFTDRENTGNKLEELLAI